MARHKDIAGQRFGRWFVIRRPPDDSKKRARWICQCDCGKTAVVISTSLRLGQSRSCGCLHRELLSARLKTHGKSHTTEYMSWHAMHQRCINDKHIAWEHYGGRGIKVCKRWQDFETFLADMGKRPEGLSLDRINNDGDYEPANCRWSSPKEQSNNRRPAKPRRKKCPSTIF
jgi:hypothetical protein